VRLDISHSKTIHVIRFVSSNTTVEDARYTLNTKSLTDLTTYISRPSDNQRHLLGNKSMTGESVYISRPSDNAIC